MLEQVNNLMGRILISGEEKSWDYGFLESITDQMNKGYTLSPRQEATFQQIQGRWSDEAMKVRMSWAQDWDDEKAEKFLIALRYYYRTGYYSNLVGKYLTINEAGERSLKDIPSMKEYNKLVENKYASAQYPYRGKTCVVLKYGDVAKVRSHAKGAKPVQVLVIGEAQPVWTEERYLKKVKKRK